jgi:adenylosuccinate synthase
MLRVGLQAGTDVIIEGTQGYALGLHAGWYPFCTPSDCRVVDFLAMTGIPVGMAGLEVEPWVVMRTFPIRVAGNSGPMKGELTWEQVGQPEERTTVTQRVRRVGTWDAELAAEAVAANGGKVCQVALMMADYWWPEIAGKTGAVALTPEMWNCIWDVEREIGAKVALVGTGPATIIDLRD